MMMMNQREVRLVNDETSIRNPDYSTEIYLTSTKLEQLRMVARNSIEK